MAAYTRMHTSILPGRHYVIKQQTFIDLNAITEIRHSCFRRLKHKSS